MTRIVGSPAEDVRMRVCPDHPDLFPIRITQEPFWECAACGRTDLRPDVVDQIFQAREKYRTETGFEPNLLEITRDKRHELGRVVLRRYTQEDPEVTDVHVDKVFQMFILTVEGLSEPDGFRVRYLSRGPR